jgi:hypothetical protein
MASHLFPDPPLSATFVCLMLVFPSAFSTETVISNRPLTLFGRNPFTSAIPDASVVIVIVFVRLENTPLAPESGAWNTTRAPTMGPPAP